MELTAFRMSALLGEGRAAAISPAGASVTPLGRRSAAMAISRGGLLLTAKANPAGVVKGKLVLTSAKKKPAGDVRSDTAAGNAANGAPAAAVPAGGGGGDDGWWICLHCQKVAAKKHLKPDRYMFKTKNGLEQHYKERHAEILKKRHFCQSCRNSFRTKAAWKKHKCPGPGPSQ